MDNELIIDSTNFDKYFFETIKHKPKKGQVLARYTAMAELVDGDVKNAIINTILNSKIGGDMAVQILKNTCHATDNYAESVAKDIANDLSGGMSVCDVKDKPYKLQIEYFYWTEIDNIPKDDVHWELISITNAELDLAYKEILAEENQCITK